jgi:hypothetical protein
MEGTGLGDGKAIELILSLHRSIPKNWLHARRHSLLSQQTDDRERRQVSAVAPLC